MQGMGKSRNQFFGYFCVLENSLDYVQIKGMHQRLNASNRLKMSVLVINNPHHGERFPYENVMFDTDRGVNSAHRLLGRAQRAGGFWNRSSD
jgi:hypothetical protein